MGMQVNYYMDHETFLLVAQKALKEGCLILRWEHTFQPQLPASDLSIVTEEQMRYYFYLPELAPLAYKTDQNDQYYLDNIFSPLSLALIEASFSRPWPAHGSTLPNINRARLYIPTGFWDENRQWVPRSERLTKVYQRLARLARKLAPAAALTVDDIDYNQEGNPEPVQYSCRIYTSPRCLEWRKEGYEFSQLLRAKERYQQYIARQKS